MTTAEQYSEACNPPRWKILGRRLRDFTPHHAQLLDQISYNIGVVYPHDLLAALRICSRGRKPLTRGWSLWDLLCLLVFKFRPQVFQQAVESFQSYLDTSKKTPRYWADKKSTRTATCPLNLMILRDIMNHYGLTEAEVLDMPYGKAQWWRLAIIEADGSLDFYTDEDEDIIQQAQRICREEFESKQKEEATNGNR